MTGRVGYVFPGSCQVDVAATVGGDPGDMVVVVRAAPYSCPQCVALGVVFDCNEVEPKILSWNHAGDQAVAFAVNGQARA